jgi:methionine S-methyltransferase
MKARTTSQPHSTVKFAAKKIYQSLTDNGHQIHAFLDSQRAILAQRSKKLAEQLTSMGWNVIEPAGGLFLSACPEKYFNSAAQSETSSDAQVRTQLADRVAEQLFADIGLLLNNSTWTGLPGFLRFVISVDEQEFEYSLQKLREFDTLWKSNLQ